MSIILMYYGRLVNKCIQRRHAPAIFGHAAVLNSGKSPSLSTGGLRMPAYVYHFSRGFVMTTGTENA